MSWIQTYQLFLFDFDGVLVDTERLHYQAYINMCAKRGFSLNWTFTRYLAVAFHHRENELQQQIYAELPGLQSQESNWSVLYEEKKALFLTLLRESHVSLMPGVADLLFVLKNAGVKRCVVTHSPLSFIQQIRKQHPILETIPHWVTREDYTHPKPHPECYQVAIAKLAQKNERIIGFEDSPRGLLALLDTPAQPVLVCPLEAPYLPSTLALRSTIHHYPDLSHVLQFLTA
jgi:beta-phosphoglucomutase